MKVQPIRTANQEAYRLERIIDELMSQLEDCTTRHEMHEITDDILQCEERYYMLLGRYYRVKEYIRNI